MDYPVRQCDYYLEYIINIIRITSVILVLLMAMLPIT